ncbi:MAG TPA: two-component regulator propeller domain-containing protein [Ignavibacteriaceae bacterium]|nr:two-component regulator propeller domain-containing protein [Ignavibacteriaceae bacterium]
MKFHILISFLILSFISNLYSQEVSNWQNYTDMKNVRSIQGTVNGFWAATSGGGFFYNSGSDKYKTLHKSDGLIGSSLNAVTIDKYGKIWLGGTNGTIDVYNPTTDKIKSILDIYNSSNTNKGINELNTIGDTILVSSDFGLSLLDSRNYVFYDTFFKFGDLLPYLKVNSTLKSNLFYLATAGGVAIQKAGAVNLSAPESWNAYTTLNGLRSNNVLNIVKFNNLIIAGTDKGLSVFNDSTWNDFLPQFNDQSVNDLFIKADSLFIDIGNTLFLYKNNVVSPFKNIDRSMRQLSYSNSMGLIAATVNGVIIFNDNTYKYPNGPAANQFPQISVDTHGNFWSASGKDGTGVGFYKYDGNSWTNYNHGNTPTILSNDYYFVNTGPHGEIYFGNWGRGFTLVENNASVIQTFTAANSPLVGIPFDTNFVVISGFANDSKGNLWILNYWPGDVRTLSMLTPDSTWYLFKNPVELNQSLEFHYNLAIDQYDTKWYSLNNPDQMGLFYFNENHTYGDNNNADDKFAFITTDDGLNSNTINSIVTDKRGDIWVGTNLGVNIITNTGSILDSQSDLIISSVFTLRQQTVNVIAVDPLNNKWIGTNQGLLYVNSDGSSLLSIFNSQNSPLPSDEIKSLAVDENTGRVYVGTDAGLTSFETPSVKPVASFSELFLYPNPFLVNDGSKQLTIDGLIKDTDIKILNIEGKLIREFSSPGGRVAYWDGKNDNGDFVASGIYFVVAFDKEGNNITTSKVAVIHK